MRRIKMFAVSFILFFTLIFSQVGLAYAETGLFFNEDGEYVVPADTDNRMFYLVQDEAGNKNVKLKVENGVMKVTFALTGTGYDYLRLGTAEEAVAADSSEYISYEEIDGKYTYTIEIPELDKELTLAAHAVKSGNWYEHKLIVYSSEEKKNEIEKEKKEEQAQEPEKKPEQESEKKPEKEPEKETSDNPSSGTVRVDSSTSLKDGTYSCDTFGWSGGTGRLAYIKCNKITVKGGQAYAEIEFSSTSYDKVKASGNTYEKNGSGNSRFIIPVEMNVNNTISGRTSAMSSPHWVTYTIYPYIEGAEKTSAKKDVKTSSKEKEIEVTHAKLFKIYEYENGSRLLEIKQENEKNGVIKYLLVPEGVEIPAGSEKEMNIVHIPCQSIWTGAKTTALFMDKLDAEGVKSIFEENYVTPDFKSIVLNETKLAILPAGSLWVEDMQEQLETIRTRFTTLSIPVIADRSMDENTDEAKAEWIKVYAALLGMEMPSDEVISQMSESISWDDYAAGQVPAEPEGAEDTESATDKSGTKWPLYMVILTAAGLTAGYAAVKTVKKNKRKSDEEK